MAVYVNKNKWRGVKIGGKNVRKIFKNGEKIYDSSAPLKNPIQGAAIMDLAGANNAIVVVPKSGWYRFNINASRGQNCNSGNGGYGARITYDLYLEQGWRILGWGASSYTTGAPASIRGGTGQSNYTRDVPGDWSWFLGGGGRNGFSRHDCGAGGGGAAGNGGTGKNVWGYGGFGGAGAGVIIYTGGPWLSYLVDDKVYYAATDQSLGRIGTALYGGYDINAMPEKPFEPELTDETIANYDAAIDTITTASGLTLTRDTANTYNMSPYAYEENWKYLLLCGGGGGSAGDNGEPRNDGAGGGAGSRGGANRQGTGGGGKYDNLPGIQYGTDTSFTSRWGNQNPPGAGNVIDVRDPKNPRVLSNRTSVLNDFTGRAQCWPLS